MPKLYLTDVDYIVGLLIGTIMYIGAISFYYSEKTILVFILVLYGTFMIDSSITGLMYNRDMI